MMPMDSQANALMPKKLSSARRH